METKRIYRYKSRKVPKSADPLLQWLLTELNEQHCSYKELADRSGVAYQTIKGWQRHGLGTMANFLACANALGYRLKPVKVKDDA